MSGKIALPRVLVELRRKELASLPSWTIRALYGSLPGRSRELASRTWLSDAVLADIIVWTEYADWNRIAGRGGRGPA